MQNYYSLILVFSQINFHDFEQRQQLHLASRHPWLPEPCHLWTSCRSNLRGDVSQLRPGKFCFVLFCFVYVISQDLRLIFTLWYNYTKTSSVTIVWLFHLTQIESFKMFLDYFWRMLYWYFVMDSLTFSPFPKI
jgi:hypothetical protein